MAAVIPVLLTRAMALAALRCWKGLSDDGQASGQADAPPIPCKAVLSNPNCPMFRAQYLTHQPEAAAREKNAWVNTSLRP